MVIAVLSATLIGIAFLALDSASGQNMMGKDRMQGGGMPDTGMSPKNNTDQGIMIVSLKGACPANQTCFAMKNITGACPDGATCYMRDDRKLPLNHFGDAPANSESKNMAGRAAQDMMSRGRDGMPATMSGGAMEQEMMSDMMGLDGMGGMDDQGIMPSQGPMGKPGQNMTGPGRMPPEKAMPENDTGTRLMIFHLNGSCPNNQTCFAMENITGNCPDGMSCYKIDNNKPHVNQPPAKPNGENGSGWIRE
jgi:hypothetical protein